MSRIITLKELHTILAISKELPPKYKLRESRQMQVSSQLWGLRNGIRFGKTIIRKVSSTPPICATQLKVFKVERRRRETINEGINELAKIVPGCEKNKGSILQRAVQYITQLRNNESQNIDKWTFEKVLTDQALQNVSAKNDTLRTKLNRARSDAEKYKKICRDAGLNLENGDDDEDDAGDTDADGDS